MDKKSYTPILAAGADPDISSARSGATAPPIPSTPPRATSQKPAPTAPSPHHEPSVDSIFRTTLNEAGEVVINILPPTLYNLTHPQEEDDVVQSNRHYRTLDPVDDILRRQLERKQPGTGVFSDLLIHWPDRTLAHSSPDIFVVRGLKRPPEEIESRFEVVKEGVVPCLVFEIVSATHKSARDKDYEFNPEHYAKAGVKELVLVEPVTKGSPKIRRLKALKLDSSGKSEEIKRDSAGRVLLETIGIHVSMEKDTVVLADAQTGERFLTSWEEEEARRAAEQRAADEAEARQAEAEAHQEAERRAAQATEALAETLLILLESRDLPLTEESRQRILACHDPNELKGWLQRAWNVDGVDELWGVAQS